MIADHAESYDADELGQYRSLSVLAVLSFLLGLSSASAFVSPLLVIVPLAGIAAALLALKSIAASDGGLTGEQLARWGIVLAVFFGVAAFSRGMVRDSLLRNQADAVAREWLALAAQENSYGVLDLMTNAAVSKFVPAVVRTETIPFFGRVLGQAQMEQDPAIAMLRQLQAQGELQIELADSEFAADYSSLQAGLKYKIASTPENQQLILLVLKRAELTPKQAVWLIDSWSLVD